MNMQTNRLHIKAHTQVQGSGTLGDKRETKQHELTAERGKTPGLNTQGANWLIKHR